MTKIDQESQRAGEEQISGDPALFYRAHVFCCTNERPAGHPRGCCKDKGSEKLRDYMKARAKELGIAGVRINSAGCLDRCELGPTMVIYPEGVWYRARTREEIDEVLQKHLVEGGRVPHLMLKPGDDPPIAKKK
jgi:(2Fe-2S) ferredoxin